MSHASQTLLFRPFAAEDADLLSRWLTAVGLGVPPGVATETWATRLVQDPHISCWAAHDRRGTTLGFLRLDTAPDLQAEITLIVAPGQRRTGIGGLLLDEALNQARTRGICKVRAVVDETNAAARKFFDAAGFSANGHNTPGHVHLHRLIHRAERQPPLEI
jgi:ribosomal protein S18 acetylase RimI-like enzyme